MKQTNSTLIYTYTAPAEQTSKTMGSARNSKSDAIISPPVSTLPANVGGLLLSEKFKSEESPSDVYSLATAAVYEVNNQLGRGGGVDIPSGTSLSDALSAKGLAGSPFNPPITPLPETSYFSPREKDVSSLYAVPQKKLPKQQSLDVKAMDPSPKHRALSPSKSDASALLNDDPPPPPPPSHRHSHIETKPNGVTRNSKESSRSRPPNYDFVVGPPRPAETSTTTHRSALLRKPNSSSETDENDAHTYINMKELHNELGRADGGSRINRAAKPDQSPRIDRSSKPMKPQSVEEDSPPDSPPSFPIRTGSISTPIVVDASDLPKPTRRTVKYSQIEFDSNNQVCLVDDQPVRAQAPIPKPRRINYSNIDIKATKDLASKQCELPKQVSLGEAEADALKEKPYINISRDGLVDDDTDPDYYTHMRVSELYINHTIMYLVQCFDIHSVNVCSVMIVNIFGMLSQPYSILFGNNAYLYMYLFTGLSC